MTRFFQGIGIPVCCVFAALVLTATSVTAANPKDYTYLALGDSVAFGYDPTITKPTPEKFVGYPETIGDIRRLLKSKKMLNASCPGQSSSTFLTGGPDIGCEAFKAAIGLKAEYQGTQAAFAVSELLSNRKINLVTLSIGGNDLSLLQRFCEGPNFEACVASGLPGVLSTFGQNLTHILTALRSQGKYKGDLVFVKQYSPSKDPLFMQAVAALNQVAVQVGRQFDVEFAEGFLAFYFASLPAGGDPCKAGLLIRLSPTSCDIHPSPLGRNILAGSVVLALGGQ